MAAPKNEYTNDEIQGNKDVGKLIEAARLSMHLTQDDIEERTGINQTFLSRIEKGSYRISIPIIYRLANAMGFELNITLKPKCEVYKNEDQ